MAGWTVQGSLVPRLRLGHIADNVVRVTSIVLSVEFDSPFLVYRGCLFLLITGTGVNDSTRI
jgi:hypothetical protein